ncbi:hypothetical protein D3C78_585040 [compost metagenome]
MPEFQQSAVLVMAGQMLLERGLLQQCLQAPVLGAGSHQALQGFVSDPETLAAVSLENAHGRGLPVFQRFQRRIELCQLLLGVVAGQRFLNGLF